MYQTPQSVYGTAYTQQQDFGVYSTQDRPFIHHPCLTTIGAFTSVHNTFRFTINIIGNFALLHFSLLVFLTILFYFILHLLFLFQCPPSS